MSGLAYKMSPEREPPPEPKFLDSATLPTEEQLLEVHVNLYFHMERQKGVPEQQAKLAAVRLGGHLIFGSKK